VLCILQAEWCKIDSNGQKNYIDLMDQITVTETAKRKGCSGQAVRDAIDRGVLDAQVFGRTYVIKVNRKFRDWKPLAVKQKAGRTRRR
jgi:hypothetical protein